jgi:hypothetical protein
MKEILYVVFVSNDERFSVVVPVTELLRNQVEAAANMLKELEPISGGVAGRCSQLLLSLRPRKLCATPLAIRGDGGGVTEG